MHTLVRKRTQRPTIAIGYWRLWKLRRQWLVGMAGTLEQYANGGERGEQRGTAKADERQRHTGEGDGGDDRADIDGGLRQEPAGDATGQQRPEGIRRAPRNTEATIGQHSKEQDDGRAADQPQLLAGDGKDAIGEGVGQIASLLDAITESTPCEAATAQRDQSLAELIRRAVATARRQRMEKGIEARTPEATKRDHQQISEDATGQRRQQMNEARASGVEHRQRQQRHHQRRTQVVLQNDQRQQKSRQDGERTQAVAGGAHGVALRAKPARQVDRQQQLRQFARLKRKRAQRQPALRAGDIDAGHQHGNQQQNCQQHTGERQAMPPLIIQQRRDERRATAQ